MSFHFTFLLPYYVKKFDLNPWYDIKLARKPGRERPKNDMESYTLKEEKMSFMKKNEPTNLGDYDWWLPQLWQTMINDYGHTVGRAFLPANN